MAFLHSKNRTKICKINKMAKKPLLSCKNVFPMWFFLDLGGGIWSTKVDSDFRFVDRKCHILRIFCPIFAISGVPNMALPVPETKIRDHFYRPNTPRKPRKNHIGNTFSQLKSGFLAILFILDILVTFLECKKAIPIDFISSFAFITLSSSEMVYRINCLQRASCSTRLGSDLNRDITEKSHLKSWLLIGRIQGI